MIEITIPGKPIAKKRPRFVRRGSFIGTYNDQETEEGKFILLAREQIDGGVVDGPIFVKAGFYMPIPKSTPKYKREMMLKDELWHTKKPDTDNLIKFVLDCLNGEAWKDDSQVVGVEGYKWYSEDPRTVITINEMVKS